MGRGQATAEMALLVARAPREAGRQLHLLEDGRPCLELSESGGIEPCYVDPDGSGWADCGAHLN
jgi:hypothetical protein